MLKHIEHARALGALTDAEADALIARWRRCYTYHPYVTPLPPGFLAERYREARATHDRRRVAVFVQACQGAHQVYDPGRE